MTAPTSPGVVPADVRELAAKAWDVAEPMHTYDEVVHIIASAIMADRANRPSLTEDEREQVRREALLRAAEVCDVAMDIEDVSAMREGLEDWEVFNHRHAERTARAIGNRLRALADRSEPRQEKEDGRG